MTEEEAVALFTSATAAIADLDAQRTAHVADRRTAVVVLSGARWSLQRIADAVGLSKSAVVKIERASR